MLVDISMPGLDGYETCRRIRKELWGRRMRVIAVTGWGQEEDRRTSAAAGFDAHLVKPVDTDRLVELLNR
jgi:two-component system CheB/CheR fusion protein